MDYEEYDEYEELEELRVIGKPSKITPKFRLLSIKDIYEMPDAEWLVEGLIQFGTLAELYGLDKSGKSFLALDWALSSALGIRWLGRSVKPGPVVYVAAEGAAGLQFRIRSWLAAHGIEMDASELEAKAPIRFIIRSVDMLNAEEVEKLVADISEALPNVGLIVSIPWRVTSGAATRTSRRT